MHATTIVAYSYNADVYCPGCIVQVLPTGPGGEFDGWADLSTPPMSAEANLDELAAAFGIDRADETTFCGDTFPKVVLAACVGEDVDHCGRCGCELP